MVCALSGLPGAIQLDRQRVVTAWFMLRSLICVCVTLQPQPPLSVRLSLSLSVTSSLHCMRVPRKLRQPADSRLFLSWCDELRAIFCAVGLK